MYRHEKGGQMEKKILYNLLFLCDSLEQQKQVIKKFKKLPEETLDQQTNNLLKAIEYWHEKDKIANVPRLNTYSTFKKGEVDLDDYFWDLEEETEIDLDEASELFVKEKEIEYNLIQFEKALNDYKETGNIESIKSIDFKDTESKKKIISMREATEAGLEKLKKVKEKKDEKSIKFSNNFFFLQLILKGLEPGELIIMAARPGVGKTGFSLALLNDISKHKKKSLFISLEMTREELTERMLIAKTGITRSVFYSQSGFTDDKFEDLVKAAYELNKQSISIIDEPPASFLEIKRLIKEEHKRNGLDIVFIDYLGLIGSYSEGDNFDTRTTISKISREAKLLAMELKIPIILLQQVNRNAAAGSRDDSSFKELVLTDLRDSGSLEQDANKVFLLWNKKPENEEDKNNILNSKYKVVLNIAKNRNGQSNQKILYEFNHTNQRIKEIDWITKPTVWKDHSND